MPTCMRELVVTHVQRLVAPTHAQALRPCARATPEATLGKVSEASPDCPWEETAGRGLRAHSHRTCHTPCYADIGTMRNELWSACYP